MPELPEVETIKNDLKKKIVNKKIARIEILFKGGIRNNTKQFEADLMGDKFLDIDRIGKLMIFKINLPDRYLLIHLKMTGQLVYCQKNFIIAGGHSLPKLAGSLPNKFSRVIFYFTDRSALFFNDMRKFGYLEIVDGKKLARIKKNYGPDPLGKDVDPDFLTSILKNRKAPVKAVLLNQKLISGIGNIYADEILFQSGIMPDRIAKNISKKETEKMDKAIKSVLRKAIKFRGTTFNDYVDSEGNQGNFSKLLKVYGKKGEACPGCPGGVIEKKRIAGRGTHFCRKCQK